MNSNELAEYVKELNKREAVEQELRRQQALNKIKQLRKQIHEARSKTTVEPQDH